MKYQIDQPKVWQAACELMVSMGVQHAQIGGTPAKGSELRTQLRFVVADHLWTNGHIMKLRRIYLAAFNGMRFGLKIEADHRAMIRNLP